MKLTRALEIILGLAADSMIGPNGVKTESGENEILSEKLDDEEEAWDIIVDLYNDYVKEEIIK